MAEPAAFSHAHKVVIDCLTFFAANVLQDERFALLADTLTRALAVARPTGLPPIDRMLEAGGVLSLALAARRAALPEWGLDWMDAMMRVQAAVQEFAWSRLGQSVAALDAETLIEPELAQ